MKMICIITLMVLTLSCGQNTGNTVKNEGALLNPKVESFYPCTVSPGVLFCITGEGFGKEPQSVKIGSQTISSFLSWDDKTIWLRIPEGIKTGDFVQAGKSISEFTVTAAPADSLKVIWEIDVKIAQDKVTRTAVDYNVSSNTVFKPPLFIKGQWGKTAENFGNYDTGWSGGVRVPMYLMQGTSVWVSECIFTPANIESCGGQPILFALEDTETENKTISGFEGDACAILKAEWARSDEFEDINTDPGVLVSKNSKFYNSISNCVVCRYSPK